MHLTHRPAERRDFDRCAALLQSDFTLDEIERENLPMLWNELISRGSMIMSVVEDHEREPDSRIVALGASVFARDRFMREAKSTRPPNQAAQLLHEEMAGDGPVLAAEAVGRANAGAGLNVFIVHYTWDRQSLTTEDARPVRDELIRAFLHEHQGYRLKEILLERHGEEAIRRVLTGGFRLRRDYADYYQKSRQGKPDPDRQPYLAGLTREEAHEMEGSTVSALFLYTPPRFQFRPGDQALLRRALMGETDEDLSETLAISPSAVKKRWAVIFEHAASVAPDLFPKDPARPAEAPRTRGAEKRRRLLAYLRHHPEDLRPTGPPKRESRGDKREDSDG